MPVEITMPRLSDTMQQGTIVKWNVKEGQKVKSGDVIADIETDKATMELPTYDDGVVARLAVPEGQQVAVGTVIAILAGAGEDVSTIKSTGGAASAPKTAAVGSASATTSTSSSSTAVMEPKTVNGHAAASGAGGRIFVSPLARKIADESGVNLSQIHGTGPSGRIVRKDVEAAMSNAPQITVPRSTPQIARAESAAAKVVVSSAGASLKGELQPLSNMRRIIAQRLVESKQTIPHYQVTVEVDMEPLTALRQQLNDQLSSQGLKLSVNDFLVRACALAMHRHPYVNSRWSENGQNVGIELLADVNLGIAIALPPERGGGLVVATVRNADQIGLRSISTQSKQLAEKARSKGLTPQEMSDSTFTISNLGMFGVSHFTAIINPPNVAILAVGAAIDRPVVRNGQLVPGKVMSMTMSSDHRVVDGAMAAQYLATVKELLEKPASLLV